tara:strand:- start:6578 stop:6898 length:321 start_codon:yes stop_codon:yes gene_type:complete
MEIKVQPRFINKETAKLLYDKGITKAEEYYYDTENNGIYPKLTQDVVRRWLREKYDVEMNIIHHSDKSYEGIIKTPFMSRSKVVIRIATTFEEALEECIRKGILTI